MLVNCSYTFKMNVLFVSKNDSERRRSDEIASVRPKTIIYITNMSAKYFVIGFSTNTFTKKNNILYISILINLQNILSETIKKPLLIEAIILVEIELPYRNKKHKSL